MNSHAVQSHCFIVIIAIVDVDEDAEEYVADEANEKQDFLEDPL